MEPFCAGGNRQQVGCGQEREAQQDFVVRRTLRGCVAQKGGERGGGNCQVLSTNYNLAEEARAYSVLQRFSESRFYLHSS
jgi:hypothetical protein